MPKQDKSKAKGSPFTAYALQGRSLDQPLGTKLPALPGCQSTLYRGTLCEKLTVPSSGFTLTDPHGHLLKSHYNSLYDPNLRQYYYRKDMLERLKKGGFITENNKVICSLKDFNEYRQYLMSVKLDYERNHKKEQTALMRRLQEPDVLPEGVCLEDVREWLLEEGRKSLWQQDRSWRKKDLAEVQERQARQVRDRARSRAEEEDQKEVEPRPSLGRCGSPQEEADRYRELEWKLKERALLERIEEDVKSEVSRQQLLREAVDGRARKRQELFEKKVALHEQMLREVISEREEFEKSIAGRFEKQKIISEINPNLKPAPPKSAKPEVVRAAPRGRNWTRLCRGQRAGCPKDRCTSRPPSSPPPRPDEAPAHLRQAGEKIGHSRTTVKVTRKDEEVTDSREASFLHISTSVTSESSSVSEGGLNAGSVRQPSVVHQLSDTHGGIEETLYGTKSLMPEAGEEVSADDSLLARSEAGGAGGAGVMENGALLCLKEILGSSRSCIMAKVESVVSQALEQAVTLGSDARSEAEQEAMLACPGRVISHPKANVLSSEIVDTVIDHVNSALLRDRLTESARGLVRSSLTSLASAQDADSFDPSDSRAISDVSEKLDPFLSDVGESACKLLGGQRDGLQPVASSEGEAEDMESALGDFAAEIISVILNGVKSESGRGAAPDSPWRFRIGSLKANQVAISIVSAVLDNLESTLLAKNIHLICPPKTERSDPISAECEHWPNESVQSGDTGECVLVRSETERLQEEADCFAEQPPAGFEPSAAVTTYSPLKDFLLPVQIVSNPETQHPGTWVSTSNLDLITTDLVRVLCAMGPTDATVPHISHASVAEAELSSPGSEGNTFEPICVPVRERSSLETAAWRKSSEHKDPTVASGVTRGILGLSRHNIIEQAEHVVVDIIKSAIDQLTPAGPGFPTTAKSPSQARINTSLSNSLAQQPMLSAVASDVVDTVICKVEQALSSTESNLFQGDASIKDSESGGVQHQSTVWKTPSEVAFAASHINTLCDDITMSVVEKLQDLMPCQTEPLSYSSSQASTSASSLTAGEPDTVAQGSQQQESGINTYAKKIVSAILCTVKGELEGKEQELAETSLSGFQKEELTLNSFAKKVVGAILDTVQNEKDSQALHKTANYCSEEWILYSEMASSVLDNLEFVECDGGTSGTKLSATGSHSSVLTLTCLKKSSDLAASKNEFRETQNILKPSRSTIIRQAEQAVLEIIEKAVDQLILSIPTVPTMTTSSSQTRISMKSPSDSLLSLVASDVVDTVLGKIESSTSSSATSLKDSDSAGQLPSPAVRTVESNTVFTPSKIYMIATDIVRSVTEKLQQLKSLSIQTFSESSPESLSSVSSVVTDGLPSAPVDTQQAETELKSYAREAVSAVLLTVQRELDREIPQGKTGVSPSAESLLVSQVVSSVLEQITNRTSDDNTSQPETSSIVIEHKSFEPLSLPIREENPGFQSMVSIKSSEELAPQVTPEESQDILRSGSIISRQAEQTVLDVIEKIVDQLNLSIPTVPAMSTSSSQTRISMKSPSDSLLSLVASDVVDTVLRKIESSTSSSATSLKDSDSAGQLPSPAVQTVESNTVFTPSKIYTIATDIVRSVTEKLQQLKSLSIQTFSESSPESLSSVSSVVRDGLPSAPVDTQQAETELKSYAREAVSAVLLTVQRELDREIPQGKTGVSPSAESLLVSQVVSSVLEQITNRTSDDNTSQPETSSIVNEHKSFETLSLPIREENPGFQSMVSVKSSEELAPQVTPEESRDVLRSGSIISRQAEQTVLDVIEKIVDQLNLSIPTVPAMSTSSSQTRISMKSPSDSLLSLVASDVVDTVLRKIESSTSSSATSLKDSDSAGQLPSPAVQTVESNTVFTPSKIYTIAIDIVRSVTEKLQQLKSLSIQTFSESSPESLSSVSSVVRDGLPSAPVDTQQAETELKSYAREAVSAVLLTVQRELDREIPQGKTGVSPSAESLLVSQVVSSVLEQLTNRTSDDNTSQPETSSIVNELKSFEPLSLPIREENLGFRSVVSVKSSEELAPQVTPEESRDILRSGSIISRQAEQTVLDVIEKIVDQLNLSIPTVPAMSTSSSQTRISMKSPSDSLLSLVASDVVDTVLRKIESSTSSSATSLKDSDSAGQLPSPAVQTVESNTVFTPSKIYTIATDIVRSVAEKLQQLKSLSIQTFSESSPESLSSVSSVVRDGLPSAPVDTQQAETELKSYAKEAVSAVLLTVQRELDREIPQGKTGVSPSAESLLVSQVVSSVLEQITNRTSDDNTSQPETSSVVNEHKSFEPLSLPIREENPGFQSMVSVKSSEELAPQVTPEESRDILRSGSIISRQAEQTVLDVIEKIVDQLNLSIPTVPAMSTSSSQTRISMKSPSDSLLSLVASDVVDTVLRKIESSTSSSATSLKDSDSAGQLPSPAVRTVESNTVFTPSKIYTIATDIVRSVTEKLQQLKSLSIQTFSESSPESLSSVSSLVTDGLPSAPVDTQQAETELKSYAREAVSAVLLTVQRELDREIPQGKTGVSPSAESLLVSQVVSSVLEQITNRTSDDNTSQPETSSIVNEHKSFEALSLPIREEKAVFQSVVSKKSHEQLVPRVMLEESRDILRSGSIISRRAEQKALSIIEKAVDQLILSIPTVPAMTTSSSQTRVSMKSPSDSLLSLVASDVVDTVLGKIESSTSSSATSLKDSDSAGQLSSPAVRAVESNTVFTPSKIYMIATDIVRSVAEKLQQLKSLSIQTFSESSPESLSSVSSVVRDGLPSAPVDTQQAETELKSYAKEAVSAVLLTVQRELDRQIPQGKTGVSPSAESLLVSQVVSSVLEQITNRTSDDNIAKPGDVQKSFEPLSIPVLEKKVCFQGAVSKQSSEGIIPTLMLGESRDILGLSGSVIIKQAKGIVLEIIERAVDQLHLSRSVPLGVAECSSQTGIKMKSPSDSLLSLVASDVVDTVLRTIESASCTPGVLSCGDVSIVDFETVGTCPNPSVCVTDSDLLIEDLVTSVMDKLKPLANSGKRAVSGPPLRDSTSLNSLMPQSLPSLPLTDIQEVEFALNSFAKEVVSSVLEVVKDELDGENLLKLSPSGPVTNSEETLLVCEIVSSVLEQLKHLEDIPGCAVPHTENTVEKTEANSHPLRSADSGVELTKLQTCNDQSSSKVSSESEFKTATIKSVCGIMERVAAKFQPPRSDHHAVESCSSALREVSDVQKHACESWSSACLPSAASDVVEAVLGKLVEVAGSEEVSDERSLGQDRCAQEPSTTLARKVDSGTWVEPSQIQGVTEELVDTVMGKLKVFLGMKSSSESQQLPAQMCGSGELKGDSFPLSGGVSVCETKSEVKSSGLSRCVQDVVSQVLHMIKTEIDGENEARASQETLLAKKVVDYFLCKVTAPKLEKLDSEKTVIITEEPCRVTSTHVEKEDLEMPDEIPVQPCDPVNVPGMVIYSQSDSTDETPTVSSRRAACSSSSKTPAPASEKEEDLFKGPGSRCTMGIRPRCRKKSLAPKDLGLSGNEPDFVSEGVTPKRNLMEKLFRGKRFTAKEQLAGETIRSSARAADPSGPTSAVRLPTGRGTAPPAGSTAPENGLAVGTVADAADSLARTRRRGIPAQLPEKTFLAPMSVSSATCSTVGSSLGQDPAMAARERRVKKLPKIAPQAVEKGLQQHPGQFEGFPAVVPVPPTCPRDKPPPHRRLLRVKMFPAQRFQ